MTRDQRGFITVDFVFAMVLILGFSALMFVLSFTLSVASITQYITYAAARNYFPAHIEIAAQEQRAALKYRELVDHPVFRPLYRNGWYAVADAPNIGDQTRVVPEFEAAVQGENKFWGAGTPFTAKVLAFRIPYFGTTVPDGDESGEGFRTYLGSYLGREPTTAECLAFTAARWEAIRNLAVTGGAAYSQGTSSNGYFPMTDDGC